MTTTNETMKNTIKCCFCGTEELYGNNPDPIETFGERCCDECNRVLVIPVRIKAANYKGNDKVVGCLKVKDQKTGALEKSFYYTYGNMEGEEVGTNIYNCPKCPCGLADCSGSDSSDSSDNEGECGVEVIRDVDKFVEKATKLNGRKEEKLKSLLCYIKSKQHTFATMGLMTATNASYDEEEAAPWFKNIGQRGENYYKMLTKELPEFATKFRTWLMPVFYAMNYIKETNFKIDGDEGDWSIGEFGSVWLNLVVKIPLVDGSSRICYMRVAFYFNRRFPLEICEFEDYGSGALRFGKLNYDATETFLCIPKSSKGRDFAEDERKRAEAKVKEQEKLFREEEKAKKQREFEEEQREKERAWRAKVEADRIAAEEEAKKKQEAEAEQTRQLIAQKEAQRVAEAKAEKERKAKEAAEKAAAKKAEKEAAQAAKFGNKKK
jgi:hypothetical protein